VGSGTTVDPPSASSALCALPELAAHVRPTNAAEGASEPVAIEMRTPRTSAAPRLFCWSSHTFEKRAAPSPWTGFSSAGWSRPGGLAGGALRAHPRPAFFLRRRLTCCSRSP